MPFTEPPFTETNRARSGASTAPARFVFNPFTPEFAADPYTHYAELRPHAEAMTDAAFDRLAEAGQADVVAELTFPLPFALISRLLGVPVDHAERLRALSGTVATAMEPVSGAASRRAIDDAGAELAAIVRELLAGKRRRPGRDLLTALASAELDEAERVAQVVLLYVAGHETTVSLLAAGLLALVRHPAEPRALRERPELAADAVEEVLRYDTPVHLVRRVTLAPTVVGGVEIPAGALVMGGVAAANRDPEFWGPDADVFRITRPDARRNLSFGVGIHHCLGAALARMQAQVVFTRFAARFPAPTLAELTWNGRINLRGPARLVLTAR
jgi:cytochrome P450